MADGLLLIDKPAGPTSHDVVSTVRRLFQQKRVGHAGTLDPAATGLLVILVGNATRFAQWLQAHDKRYEGAIRLGVSTDTLDAEGEVTDRTPCPPGALDRMYDVARSFIGEQDQTPPQYSAIKIGGVPAYKSARRGTAVDIKARKVTLYDFTVAPAQTGELPLVEFQVSCSAGTYIRSLAFDFGARLGCAAHLERLRRISIGSLGVERGITIDGLRATDDDDRPALLITVREALEMPEVTVAESERKAVANGREFEVLAPVLAVPASEAGPVKIISDDDNYLLGLGKIVGKSSDGLRVKPFLVTAR